MPRILLSTAHIAPLVLDSLGVEYIQPCLASKFPPLPRPFYATAERIELLQETDVAEFSDTYRQKYEESAKKPFCNIERTKAMSP